MFNRFKKSVASSGAEYLIVGLGNPGAQYQNTRHNAGFIAIDALAGQLNAPIKRIKFKSLLGQGELAGHKVLLLKPSTYMNLSGQAVCEAMQFYKIPPQKTIILFDDISLDVGKMRIRQKGSDGGHNGMKNIIYLSGSDQFPRIKIGVGNKPHPDYDLADWVLSAFSKQEREKIDDVAARACKALALMVEDNLPLAMSKYNG